MKSNCKVYHGVAKVYSCILILSARRLWLWPEVHYWVPCLRHCSLSTYWFSFLGQFHHHVSNTAISVQLKKETWFMIGSWII